MNDMEIRKVVYGLLQAGLVEIVRSEGAPVITPVSKQPTTSGSREEQVSLVNRLIRRIRSL